MSVSTLQLSTEDAARIIKRLANHWRHKMTVSEQPQALCLNFRRQPPPLWHPMRIP